MTANDTTTKNENEMTYEELCEMWLAQEDRPVAQGVVYLGYKEQYVSQDNH